LNLDLIYSNIERISNKAEISLKSIESKEKLVAT